MPDPPMLGVHFARGASNGQGQSGRSPLLIYHNGSILPTSATATIFWGASWANSSFVGDKISGLDLWYAGEGGTNFAKTTDEYTALGQQVTRSATA